MMIRTHKEEFNLSIHHNHPDDMSEHKRTETLAELYRACIRKLRGTTSPWALSLCGSPAPSAR